jgi:hypothetical protein
MSAKRRSFHAWFNALLWSLVSIALLFKVCVNLGSDPFVKVPFSEVRRVGADTYISAGYLYDGYFYTVLLILVLFGHINCYIIRIKARSTQEAPCAKSPGRPDGGEERVKGSTDPE